MSFVWMVHPIDEDISAALRYGPIKYINRRYVHPDELQPDKRLPAAFLVNMTSALDAWQPDDFLMVAGDHLQLVQFSCMLRKTVGEFLALRFDRQAKGYYQVRIC